MAKHNETGIKGEQIAENFLLKKGYSILHRNWCFGKHEVDLIAEKDNTLIIIEVKTRSSLAFGFPEDAVTPKKQGYLKSATEAFLDQHPQYERIQFDIISIHVQRGETKEIMHFEDAFY
ncbi:MAG: YraN family protein [Sphingobacteriales bacterium]|nr:MAG: YraN family protein [Sphingobacteriales bacterium]